jgi:hypothetical protein
LTAQGRSKDQREHCRRDNSNKNDRLPHAGGRWYK